MVYALVEAAENALYKSTDGGFPFAKQGRGPSMGIALYYADIFVDPENENDL